MSFLRWRSHVRPHSHTKQLAISSTSKLSSNVYSTNNCRVGLDHESHHVKRRRFSSFHYRQIQDTPISGVLHNTKNVSSGDSDSLDQWLAQTIRDLPTQESVSVHELYAQYRNRSGRVIDRVVPYEESPKQKHRADYVVDSAVAEDAQTSEGSGIVTVVYALRDENSDEIVKFCVCSGFVVDAKASAGEQGSSDTIITCAHTLEEMHRYLQQHYNREKLRSFSCVILSTGRVCSVLEIMSSMPRSDTIAMRIDLSWQKKSRTRLRSLPLSPFPVYAGTPVLTHLFGSPEIPNVNHSKTRIATNAQNNPQSSIEEPVAMFDGKAWRRWGKGIMLGYRSYTGQEIEAGISSILPHILTSILPTPGSSGGPLVNAETGCVVGMISGRRMDNRVEGERGWGASAETIFEMFSLPGFTPASRRL